MTRREAREQAFQILFEQAVTGAKIDDILHDASEARDFIPNSFAEEVAFGVEENSQQIDSVISQHIRGWSLHRLSKVALALLRLAVYEMLFDDSIPTSVSINEAVELAKKYSTEKSSRFVNGVLGSAARSLKK